MSLVLVTGGAGFIGANLLRELDAAHATFDTIRQAAVGMPAIMIRQLEALAKIIEQTPDRAHQTPLIRQAEAIQRSSLATVADPSDRHDVTQRYEAVLALVTPVAAAPEELRLA